MRSLTIVVLGLACAARVHATDITACGQAIADLDTGVLQGDLACPGDVPAVSVGRNATLDMNGHAITGPIAGNVVACLGGRCTVKGPGDISGSTGDLSAGIGGSAIRAVLTDLDIHGNVLGVSLNDARIVATNVTAHDNASSGISGHAVIVTNVTVTGNGLLGIGAGGRIRGKGVVANDNATDGVFGGRVVLDDLVAQGNHNFGVSGAAVRLSNSTVTGNNGISEGYDLAALSRPHLLDSTCGKSQKLSAVAGENWGVCTDDPAPAAP